MNDYVKRLQFGKILYLNDLHPAVENFLRHYQEEVNYRLKYNHLLQIFIVNQDFQWRHLI